MANNSDDPMMQNQDVIAGARAIRRNPAQLAELTAPPANDDPNAAPAGYASGLTGGPGRELSYAGGRRGAAPRCAGSLQTTWKPYHERYQRFSF